METDKETKELLEKLKKAKLEIIPCEKSPQYYEGFYDGIQAILKIIKGA